jgi:hypothetical protein
MGRKGEPEHQKEKAFKKVKKESTHKGMKKARDKRR